MFREKKNEEEEEKEKEKKEEKEKRKIERNIGIKNEMAMNMYLSIITLNVNGLNVPIKTYRVAE